MKENKFYVYVYLNPLKKGNFTYIENGIGIDFEYAPFYIGKGCGERIFKHLEEAKRFQQIDDESELENIKSINRHKINTINKIKDLKLEPIIYKIIENINSELACNFEKFLIKLIGRVDLKTGILTNQTDGGEGGYGVSEEVKKNRRETHSKTLENNPSIIENLTLKRLETEKNNPEIGIQRITNIKKNYKDYPENKKLRDLQISKSRILNKSTVGDKHSKYKHINYEFLITKYFEIKDIKTIINEYNYLFPTNIITRNDFIKKILEVLGFPINSFYVHEKRNTYLKFVEKNKNKLNFYIDNYKDLENNYNEKQWKERHKYFLEKIN